MIDITGNISIGKLVNNPGSTFNADLQEKYNVVMSGILARDDDGQLSLWIDPPKSAKVYKSEKGHWFVQVGSGYMIPSVLDNTLFPDVHIGADYPTEVKIRIM